MTESDPQTRAALLELAALDVCGLLDEYERSRFDREFHDAPQSVREDVLRLQAELAADTSLLPSDEPDASLRQRVLDAVNRTVDAETSRLAPLATIGRARRDQDAMEQRRWPFSTAAMWRAAAFALATATIVMGYMLSNAYKEVSEIFRLALTERDKEKLIEHIGPDFFVFTDNPYDSRVLSSTNGGAATGMVFIGKDSNLTYVVAVDLPELEEGMQYTLRATDGDEVHTWRFDRDDVISFERLDDVDTQALVACKWAILDPEGNPVLLS